MRGWPILSWEAKENMTPRRLEQVRISAMNADLAEKKKQRAAIAGCK
jgi:hypothetical protein